MSTVESCTSCQELVKSRSRIVNGKGNLNAKIMIIGEAPGWEEDHKGEPFVGRSGRLLNATLAKLGIKREDIYITNVVKCRPPANRKPYQQEIKRCQKYLQREVGMVTPKVIVTLGLSATEVIYEGGLTMGEVNGKPLCLASGIVVVPVYHPSAVLRNPNLRESFERALKVAIEESKKP